MLFFLPPILSSILSSTHLSIHPLLLLFSHPVMSGSLWPCGLQHAKLPCPSSSPGVCPSSCSLCQWCCAAISFSDALFSFCPQSFPADFSNESTVHIRWPKYWSFSLSPSSKYSGLVSLKMDWLDLLVLQGTLRSLFQWTTVQRHQFFGILPSLLSSSHKWVTTGKTISLTIQTFCQSSNVSAFQHTVWVCHRFPAKKQSSSAFMAGVTGSDFGAQEEEICHDSHLLPLYLPCSNGTGCHDLSCWLFFFFFLIFNLKPALSLSSFTLIKSLFSSSSLSAIRVVSTTYLRLLLPSTILIPVCNSSSLAFLLVWSAYRLNKQGDSRQPCHAAFSILNQPVV